MGEKLRNYCDKQKSKIQNLKEYLNQNEIKFDGLPPGDKFRVGS